MLKSKNIAALVVALAIALMTIPAVAVADIVGIWWAPERDSKIEIARDSSGIVSGRIIAILPADADKKDDENPAERLRDRRVLGLLIIESFKPDAEDKWSDGTIYDPENGRTYKGTLWLDGANRLMMRGYVGISLFGRTETLVRVEGPLPESQQPGEPDLVYLAR